MPEPVWTQDCENLLQHINSCTQCKKAGRLRFCGATVDEINQRRCDEGKKLAELAFKELE